MWSLSCIRWWTYKIVRIDGPEFDAHKVDFDEMLLRLNGYKDEECKADASYKESIAK